MVINKLVKNIYYMNYKITSHFDVNNNAIQIINII